MAGTELAFDAAETEPDVPIVGANPESAKLNSYPAFDWLRFVLASIVVLNHERVVFPGPIDGGLAVQVFFALSGWLIGGILLKTKRSELPRFFFNRATRIWIPYIAAICLLYGFAALYQGVNWFWVKYLFYDSTFTHQLFTQFPQAGYEMPLGGSGNQFWSISVEEQFYLFAPLVMLLPFGRELVSWSVIAAAVLFVSVLGAPICLGVIAAIMRRDFGDWHLGRIARPAVLFATFVILAALFLWDNTTLRAIFAVGVVLSAAVPGERYTLPVFLGGISYPLYLNHWAGAFVAHGFTRHVIHEPDGAVYVSFAYSASILIAVIAYLLIDRKVLAKRQKWFTRFRGVACGATAYTLLAIGVIVGTFISLR